MQYILKLPGKELKFYYNDKVYSPAHSSADTIMVAHKAVQGASISVLDVGCGSGILGLGLKALDPQITLYMSDISPEALRVARLNAKRLGLYADIFLADLLSPKLQGHNYTYDMIIANLPTYDQQQMDKLKLYGPQTSYLGPGLKLYEKLFGEAQCRVLVCECQARHQTEFLELAKKLGWELILSTDTSFGFIKLNA